MAYDFNGTTANLELGSALASAAPLTLFARVTIDTVAATTGTIIAISGNSGTHLFQLRRNTDTFEATASEGATIGTASGGVFTVGPTAYVLAAVFASPTSRTLHYGVGLSATNATSVTPTSLNRTNVGARYNGGSLGSFHDGTISEVAIWNAAITDDEYVNLFNGASPIIVRPASLVAYFPLIANLNDRKANQAFTNTAATVVPHPKVRYPCSAI